MSETKIMENEFREKGRKIMEQMVGKEYLEKANNSRARYADFQDWTQRVLFGEVWGRENLDLRTRSLCVVAALTVMDKPKQIRTHISAAINNGAKPEEILEVIMQMAFYGGWPGANTALAIATEVFEERGL